MPCVSLVLLALMDKSGDQLVSCAGCLNGGAQVRPAPGDSTRELSQRLESIYKSLPQQIPEKNAAVKDMYASWLGGPNSDECASLLHTTYHAVDKMNTALNIKW